MNESKSARYHRLRRRTVVLSASAAALLQIGLVTTSGSMGLREWAEAVAGGAAWLAARPWLAIAVYAAALAACHEALAFPFLMYRGFLLDRRYGLSREPFGAWLRDHVKGALVGLGFGLAAAIVLYACLRARPDGWWWLAGLVFSLASVALTGIAPALLLPIFYRVRPLTRDALRARLQALAERTGRRVVGIYEWHLGERTRRANAALVGLGRTRRILVSDTLLGEYSDDEIEAILAHELGHHVRHDIWRALLLESVVILAGFYAAQQALRVLGPLAGLAGPGDVSGLPIILLAVEGVSAALLPLANALSRHHERRADRFALALTGRPAAFVSAMRRLAAQNLAEEHPSRLARALFHTHPPVHERIAAVDALER